MEESKRISSKLFNINLSATVNPKAFLTTILFEFNTKENDLLNALLYKYKNEKYSLGGSNLNNKICSIVLGDSCICMTVAPEYVYQNIVLLLSYLHKTEIDTYAIKHISGDYDTLMKDISNVKITIVGKTKRIITAIDKLEERIKDGLDKIKTKSRKAVSGNKNEDTYSVTIDTSDDLTLLYISFILGDIACSFSKSCDKTKLSFLHKEDMAKFEEKVRSKERIIYQTQVRSFLTQSGSIGTPSAQDTDGSKFKKKVENILSSENTYAYIYSHLRGFNYKFKSSDDLKNVDKDAIVFAVKFMKM